jgi:hypothetical protein
VDLGRPDGNGRLTGCVDDRSIVSVHEITTGQDAVYVDVHTAQRPDGAVRGQLLAAAALAG